MAHDKTSYTSGQIAHLLGIPARTTRRYLQNGKISGHQNPITGRWIVSQDSLNNFINTHKVTPELVTDSRQVLITGTDQTLAEYISATLRSFSVNFTVDVCFDFFEALIKLGRTSAHLLIVSPQNQTTDEKALLAIRSSTLTNNTKVIAILEKSEPVPENPWQHADSVLIKPFGTRELLFEINKLFSGQSIHQVNE